MTSDLFSGLVPLGVSVDRKSGTIALTKPNIISDNHSETSVLHVNTKSDVEQEIQFDQNHSAIISISGYVKSAGISDFVQQFWNWPYRVNLKPKYNFVKTLPGKMWLFSS